MSKIFTSIGLMSGTSMDGVDAALLKTDGEDHVQNSGQTAFRPYGTKEQAVIAAAIEEMSKAFELAEKGGSFDRKGPAGFSSRQLSKLRHGLKQAQEVVLQAHEQVVRTLLDRSAIGPEKIDLIGFHGQTVLHRPEQGITVQLGYGERLADRLGIPVVAELRQADIRAGGQGAPLVPVYHRALVKQGGLALPVAVLNVGGVANVTYIGADGEMIAFDTGPGNALIDDWVRRHNAGDMDKGGEIAARGRVKESVLATLLADPYFSMEPPKSLDRNHFSIEPLADLSLEWGAMTLTSFTALAASRADFFFPMPPEKWIICGGGAHNPVLMNEFQKRLSGEVLSANELGWSPDYMEAEAFAYLAVRSIRGLPLTFPGTTGVPAPQTGGVLHKPQI